jgi:hypothetical protein
MTDVVENLNPSGMETFSNGLTAWKPRSFWSMSVFKQLVREVVRVLIARILAR